MSSSNPQVFQTSQLLADRPTLLSVRLPDLPIATVGAVAIVIARNVYVCGGWCGDVASSRFVKVYDLDKAEWTKLPPAPQYLSEAVAVNNQLVLLGGREASSYASTNIVSTWTGQSWQQNLPAMPTRRLAPSVTAYNTFVVVAGGKCEDDTLLSNIDVLDIATQQWWTPANLLQLPQPMYSLKMSVCATHVCVTSAGISFDVSTKAGMGSQRVWQLPVSELEEVLANEDHRPPHKWMEVAPTLNYDSALLQDTDHPVVVGGHDDLFRPSSDIAVYDARSNKWSTVGQLLEPRTLCSVVCLSRHSFLVLGGCSDERKQSSTQLSSVELVYMPCHV